MTIRDIAIAVGYKVDESSHRRVTSSIDKIISKAKSGFKAVGAAVTALLLGQVTQMVEQYDQINARLAYATDYLGNQVELQNAVAKAAQDTRSTYAGIADAVGKMVQDTNSWALTTNEALSYATQLTKVFRGAGMSREGAANMVSQFAASFQNGRLQNLSQMLQQAPELINYLAKSLNMSTDAVKALASAGAISLKQFTQAIYENAGDIEKRFKQIPQSLSEVFAYMKERLSLFLSQINQRFKIFESISEMFDIKGQFTRAMEERGMNPDEKGASIMSLFESLMPYVESIVNSLKEITGGVLRSVITTIVDFLNQNGPLLKSIFQIIADIFKLIETLMPYIEDFIEGVTEFINAVIATSIGKVISWIADALSWIMKKLHISTDYEQETANATKAVADATTKEASVSTLNNNRNVTIFVDNDYTFNGADRSAQKEAVNYVRKGAEDIYTDLKLSLNYAG